MVNENYRNLGTSRSVIRELFEFGKKRAAEIGEDNVFDFSLGNPTVPSPDCINETAIKLLQEDSAIHLYTQAQGDIKVRTRIIKEINDKFKTNYSPDTLYITAGAAAAITATLCALICENDEIVLIAPYFPEYTVFAKSTGAKINIVPPDYKNFQINFEELEKSINENTKLLIINSPNNPTGVIYSKETIQKLSDLLDKKSAEYGNSIYLVADEPYREIAFSKTEVPWVPNFYKNTIVCYSYSKSLSLPGERLGYVLVPEQVCNNEDVYAAVMGAGRALGYVNAPSLFQHVISLNTKAVSDISIYETNANVLAKELGKIGYEYAMPQGAFYFFMRCPNGDDIEFSNLAREFDILLVPGSGFGAPGFVRMAFCMPTEKILRSIPKFKELFDSLN